MGCLGFAEFGGQIAEGSITEFIDGGGNVLVAANSDIGNLSLLIRHQNTGTYINLSYNILWDVICVCYDIVMTNPH